MKKNNETSNTGKIDFIVTDIKKKVDTEKGCIFDFKVNGVAINGASLFEYTKDGVDDCIIKFPGVKDKNDKKDENGYPIYYNSVWFPISRDLRHKIYEELKKQA